MTAEVRTWYLQNRILQRYCYIIISADSYTMLEENPEGNNIIWMEIISQYGGQIFSICVLCNFAILLGTGAYLS
jgi:hypothetical protein